MDRILEARYTLSNRIATLQKEKTELPRKSKEVQDSRTVEAPEAKRARPLGKDRGDRDARAERGRERPSLGHS